MTRVLAAVLVTLFALPAYAAAPSIVKQAPTINVVIGTYELDQLGIRTDEDVVPVIRSNLNSLGYTLDRNSKMEFGVTVVAIIPVGDSRCAVLELEFREVEKIPNSTEKWRKSYYASNLSFCGQLGLLHVEMQNAIQEFFKHGQSLKRK